MEKIKYVHRQDCGFKLSAGNSGETSLNLSNEILDLIAKGTMQLGQEREVSFKIYKEDCIKAICFIVLKLPLYQSSSNSSVKITDGMATFQKLLAKVNSIFGDDDCVDYIVNLYYRTDGRIYLNRLKVNDFSIRDVLVENNSAMLFKEETDGKIAIRILSNIQDREEANNETPNYKEYLRIKSAATFLKEALLITKRKDPNLVNLEKLNKYRKTDKQLLIANYKLGRNKNYLPARLSDVALDVEWQYDGIDYVLDLELVPRDMEMLFFPAYNEAYQGIFQMKKDANEEYVLYEIISNSDKLDEPNQLIYYGAPGTGKSHEVKKQTGEWISDEEEQDLPNVFRTTFHPDTDYASFVGCYKPTMKPTSKEEKTLTGKDEEIVYEYVPQVFTDAYVYAYANPNQDTFLVIEEINRGNCAQIFGDLFQLLDRKNGISEYTIKADKDLAKHLVEVLGIDSEGVKDGKLRLPANLHILATMNTSDQSLFPMDSAFKRRWDWEYIPIKYSNSDWRIDIAGYKYSWIDFQTEINKRIFGATESEDKQLGDFFVKADDNNIISSKLLLNKVIFYLWNDVCKDGDGDIFKVNKDLDYSKELDPAKNEDITFSKFFKETDLKLKQWMRYLNIKPLESQDDEEKEDEAHQQEEGVKPNEAKSDTYSKPEYKSIIENMLPQLSNEDISIFKNGFDWSFSDMPGSYARMSLALDAPAKNKKANVKVWVPAPTGYSKSAECFAYLKDRGGEDIIRTTASKYGYEYEELGIHSKNPNPVVGWKITIPMTFAPENSQAESQKLLDILSEVRTAFDPIISDFLKK